mgnify:CR=1 FL=1
MKDLKISHKIFLLSGAMLLVFFLVVSWMYLDAKRNYVQARRDEIRHVVEAAWGVLDYYASLADSGQLDQGEAQRKAIAAVGSLRFDDDNYYWINDFGPRMVMHPFNRELIGEDLSDYRDPQGKALFVEMAELCRRDGQGFIQYVWHKPGSTLPAGKVSFVKQLPQWDWIVGAGVYTDDIDRHLAKVFYTTFGVFLALLIGAVSFTLIVSRQISLPLGQAVDAMEKLGSGNFDVHLGMARKDEIGRMANAIDACVGNLRKLFEAIRSM